MARTYYDVSTQNGPVRTLKPSDAQKLARKYGTCYDVIPGDNGPKITCYWDGFDWVS